MTQKGIKRNKREDLAICGDIFGCYNYKGSVKKNILNWETLVERQRSSEKDRLSDCKKNKNKNDQTIFCLKEMYFKCNDMVG